MRFKSIFWGCLWLLLLAAFAGCGGGGGTESNQKGSNTVEETSVEGSTAAGTTSPVRTQGTTLAKRPIETIQVNETEMSLDPSDITLDRPGTYVFRAVNVGKDVHALKIEGNGIQAQQTREIGPGESADLTVTLGPGSYEIDCPVDNHEELGMKGTVTVVGGD